MLSTEASELLKRNVGRNLSKLLAATNWTQAAFADRTGVSEPTLSNYLINKENPARIANRLPPLDFLVDVCSMPEFKNAGLDLSLDMLISDDFNPAQLIKKRSINPSSSRLDVDHWDFIGNYICYFFEQSSAANQDSRQSRELRYGIVSVYDEYRSLTGKASVRAAAAFFKASEESAAYYMKENLDKLFAFEKSVDERNRAIAELYAKKNLQIYTGQVNFTDYHGFINLHSDTYGDNALIILYLPQKKNDSEYIGGLGSVTSVSRGNAHMPTAQKIILSRYKLGCSQPDISSKLNMSVSGLNQDSEAAAICDFCSKLYSDKNCNGILDEADRKVMLQNRINRLITNYIKKNVCSVGAVTEDEDRDVFRLIELYSDKKEE